MPAVLVHVHGKQDSERGLDLPMQKCICEGACMCWGAEGQVAQADATAFQQEANKVGKCGS